MNNDSNMINIALKMKAKFDKYRASVEKNEF